MGTAGAAKPELLTLHTKADVIDRNTIVVGSINFDPRSLVINSEMGLFIESGSAGKRFINAVVQSVAAVTWRVSLDESDNLVWTYNHNGAVEVETTEPLTSMWQRFMVCFYRTLPIEGQL